MWLDKRPYWSVVTSESYQIEFFTIKRRLNDCRFNKTPVKLTKNKEEKRISYKSFVQSEHLLQTILV